MSLSRSGPPGARSAVSRSPRDLAHELLSGGVPPGRVGGEQPVAAVGGGQAGQDGHRRRYGDRAPVEVADPGRAGRRGG